MVAAAFGASGYRCAGPDWADWDALRGIKKIYRGHKPRGPHEAGINAESTFGHPRLSWIIIGGESGRGARPFALAWARSVIDQCKAAGVAVFVKQLGSNPRNGIGEPGAIPTRPPGLLDHKGGDPAEWPEDLRIREMPRQGAS